MSCAVNLSLGLHLPRHLMVFLRKLSKVQMNNIALTLVVIFYGYFSFVLRQLVNMRARKDPSFSIEGVRLLFLALAHLCSVVYCHHPVQNLVGHIALWHLFYLRLMLHCVTQVASTFSVSINHINAVTCQKNLLNSLLAHSNFSGILELHSAFILQFMSYVMHDVSFLQSDDCKLLYEVRLLKVLELILLLQNQLECLHAGHFEIRTQQL